MPSTNVNPPTAYSSVGSSLGDGNTYVNWTYPTRMYTPGSNVCVASGSTAGNRATLWKGCFSSQIPSNATIIGIELVGLITGKFGNAGSTSISESLTYSMHLYNGVDYVEVPFLSTPSGGTLSSNSMELTLTGGNKYYRDNTSTDSVLAGSSTSTFGLSWNPNNQANFGFVISTNAKTYTPVGIIDGQGNIGLKIYYNSIYPHKLDSIITSNIDEVTTVDISNVQNRSFPGNSIPAIDIIYQFEGELTETNANLNWIPSNDWVNGPLALSSTYWGRSSNKTVKGWNCDLGTTPSSTTGPLGGVIITGGTQNPATKYIYTEVSNNRNTYCFVARTPVIPLMNHINNDLTLKFWVHAYGAAIGDLYVYIDDATTSNHSSATELGAYENWQGFTSSSSNYQQITISLNNYRSNTTDYYIYFVSQNATSWQGDLTIDGIQIIEG